MGDGNAIVARAADFKRWELLCQNGIAADNRSVTETEAPGPVPSNLRSADSLLSRAHASLGEPPKRGRDIRRSVESPGRSGKAQRQRTVRPLVADEWQVLVARSDLSTAKVG